MGARCAGRRSRCLADPAGFHFVVDGLQDLGERLPTASESGLNRLADEGLDVFAGRLCFCFQLFPGVF